LRILLLSDIHSNLEALEACLAVAPSADFVVNLGDIVGYGASPNEVTAKARGLGKIFVRGNHDKVVAGIDSVENFNPIAGVSALWNRDQLTPENLDWLGALPEGPLSVPDVPAIQLVHGAPDDEDRYVISVDDALQTLAISDCQVIFFGHTHVQGLFSLRGGVADNLHPDYPSIAKQETYKLQLETGSTYLVNPGSVGQPRDGDWRAAFALFNSEEPAVTFYRVPYDLRSAQERIFAAKLPPRLATRLAAGR
jgi:predicted phosphodiesterase